MELYLIKIQSNEKTKTLLCNGKKRVLKKIEEYIWEQEREFVFWFDYVADPKDLTEDVINELHLFKKGYSTFNNYTFSILDMENI